MKQFKIIILFVFIVLSASQSFAFDGNRKGFTMGLGLGYAPYANPDLQNYPDDYSFNGFGMNFMIGYNWNKKNLLVWEVQGAINVADSKKDDIGFLGINGILWYHYLKDTPKSFYSILVIGRTFSVSVREYTDSTSIGYGTRGTAIAIGGGYEFTKQLQLSTYYVRGKSSDYSIKATNNMIYMSVTLLAY